MSILGEAMAAAVAAERRAEDNSPHVVVEALAGTGKTWTMINGVRLARGMRVMAAGSPEQKAIWDQFDLSCGKAQSFGFLTFGHDIAEELKQKVPQGCDARTFHSFGAAAIRAAFPTAKFDKDRSRKVLERVIRAKPDRRLNTVVIELVRLCKIELVEPGPGWRDRVLELAGRHEVDADVGGAGTVPALVAEVLKKCQEEVKTYDHADMIWLPVVLKLEFSRYDLLVVDEAQDINRCQQEIALRAGRRIIVCGDRNQAIFAFAGADHMSMERLRTRLEASAQKFPPRGCVTLPLTVSRRCGKAVAAEARRYVPEFKALPNAPQATVSDLDFDTYRGRVQGDDLVMCRVNAPLIGEYFKFMRAGRKARLLGRGDVDDRLVKEVTKAAAPLDPKAPGSAAKLIELARLDMERETRREESKASPNEHRLIGIEDRFLCIQAFAAGASSVDDVIAKIVAAFDGEKGVRLSSIHKAKGLEARRAFLLQLPGASCPHPRAKSDRQRRQEDNLMYVAITRGIEEFCYVRRARPEIGDC